jgi:1,4-alpha-glucan branching enzyme
MSSERPLYDIRDPSSIGIGPLDIHLFHEGTHQNAYATLGAHVGGAPFSSYLGPGTRFAVWAPAAHQVSVIGDWNYWSEGATRLQRVEGTGIWAGVDEHAQPGHRYKLSVVGPHGQVPLKSDPFGFYQEHLPGTASVVHRFSHVWSEGDARWMAERRERFAHASIRSLPLSVYEVHPGSWQRGPFGESLGYRELAPQLAAHVKRLGFTHVELMPVMEHPFGGSWGYQVTGYFAPTSRYGTPEDFMFFVDYLHAQGIGVLLDWPPAHFASDSHGLGAFDGTALFEHADPRQGIHPEWTSYIFNYGRNEVKSFLTSNALFWLERYHIDGLRVDGVASMLYLDYAREAGDWIPNPHGGRENLEAVSLLRAINGAVRARMPDTLMIAEESTAWPQVTGELDHGGLGFHLKWDLGWMHDSLRYLNRDPVHRKYHHRELTFRGLYAYNEAFMLPLSHDEVVHGKGSLLRKMAGDEWQKRANLRLLLGFMFASPGKKLLFMGSELAGWDEWNESASLPLWLLERPEHAFAARLIADLNALYISQPSLYALDTEPGGLSWLQADDAEHSVVVIERRGTSGMRPVIAAFNFTPIPRYGYRVGVHDGGAYRELLNTDSAVYGGSGVGNMGEAHAHEEAFYAPHRQACPFTLSVTVPPLGAVFLTAAS